MDASNDVVGCDTRAVLVTLLKDHTIVLNKSLLPNVSIAKEKAWKLLSESFSTNTGKEVTVSQLKKLLNNMKTAIKKKTVVNATGNKIIKLLTWETDFLKILEANENPVFCKVPGAMCSGLNEKRPSTSRSDETSKDSESETENIGVDEMCQEVKKTNVKKMGNKKIKLFCETDETANLTTGQLQRLLLLEQIKLTRLQSKREEMLINNMKSNVDQSVFVVDEGENLNEFLILKE